MFATLEKATHVSTNVNTNSTKVSDAKPFTNVSRFAGLVDFSDEFTKEALRRAAEIRQNWTEEEIARRKQVGQKRRDTLSQMLAATV